MTQRILLVHDDVTAAREMEARLSSLDYEVKEIASSGDEALAAAARIAPELVLIALRDEAAGVATATALGQELPVPVVLLGEEPDEAGSRPTVSAGESILLLQPFTDRELRLAIDLAVCRHEAAVAVHEMDGFFGIASDLFCFLDFNGYFKRLNPAWEKALGFTIEELKSRPFIEFVHPDDRERTLRQNARVRAGGRAVEFMNRYRRKDGSYRWFLWSAAPLSAEGVIYSVARDVTASKQAEAERDELVRSLEASLAEVRTLRDILPICMYCKQVRDDENYWHTVESYVSQHTRTRFSHGICPSCMASRVEPDLQELEGG